MKKKSLNWSTKADEYLLESDLKQRKCTTLGKHIEKRLRLKVLRQHYAITKVKKNHFPKYGWECLVCGKWKMIISSQFKEYVQDIFCTIYPPTLEEEQKAMLENFDYIDSISSVKKYPDFEKRFGVSISYLEEFAEKNFDNVKNVIFFI